MALFLVKGYQAALSPYLGGNCRYWPSCSQYSYQAIERFGTIKGTWLTARRFARCRPFGGGGYDPVP